ncbi:DUF4129 domain-containing protein [Rubrivirga sp.]|uniref:DUF4129 domain-containing protein n=1 Tax=Rubrivirga sp. TaxID=1885344 RepID=UPI003B528E98
MTLSVVWLAVVLQAPVPPPLPPPAPPPVDVGEKPDVVFEEIVDVLDAPLATDTLRPRPVPATVDAYRADPDFQYDDVEAEGASLWELIGRWLRRTLWDPIRENTTSDARWTVAVLVAVAVLGWAVSRLLRAEGAGGVFARRAGAGGGVGPLLDAEDIGAVDLGTRLRDALGRGDHREAVRVRYLLLLQALDAAGALAWRRDKTNREYVAEVSASDRAHAGPFARATRAFDAVWYGERPVSPALYADLAPVFDRAAPRPS